MELTTKEPGDRAVACASRRIAGRLWWAALLLGLWAGAAAQQPAGGAAAEDAPPADAPPADEPGEAPAGPGLLPGQPAPPFAAIAWLAGAPVARLDPGLVHVLALVEPGCPNCEEAITVLELTQERFRADGLVVIVARLEEAAADPEPGGEQAAVAEGGAAGTAGAREEGDAAVPAGAVVPSPGAVAAAANEATPLRVCVAAPELTSEWWQPSGVSRPPVLFAVDREGLIAWYGHDVRRLEEILPQVMAGTWDAVAEAERVRRRIENRRRANALLLESGRARRTGDHAAAIAALDQVLALDAEEFGLHATQRFQLTLIDKQDATAAYEFLRAHMKEYLWRQPQALGTLARMILSDRRVRVRDAGLARELATRSVELTGEDDAVMLEILALAHHQLSEHDLAVARLERAASLAIPGLRARYERLLEEYRRYQTGSGAPAAPPDGEQPPTPPQPVPVPIPAGGDRGVVPVRPEPGGGAPKEPEPPQDP